MNSTLVDYHAHTVLCNHACGTVDEYLERAAEIGLAEFGFSEHSHWMAGQAGDRRLCPTRAEMTTYFRWMDERRNACDGASGKPKLRVGLEADWVPESLGEALKFVESYPFDYIHGSVHHLRDRATGDWRISWKFSSDEKVAYIQEYCEAVRDLAQSGLCDILAHIDVIRRGPAIDNGPVIEAFKAVIPDIAASGVAAEINTSGLDNELGAWIPCEAILHLLVKAGVPITFGSDSHAPSHVGRHFDAAVNYLKRCGGTEFVRFEERRMTRVPLP